MVMLKKAINLFYKLAISDYPDWIPEEHKQKLEAIESIEKDPRLRNFRISIRNNVLIATSYEQSILEALHAQAYNMKFIYDIILNKSSFKTELENISDEAYSKIFREQDKEREKIDILLNLLSHKSEFVKVLRENKILVGTQEPAFSKFYDKIVSKHNKIKNDYNEIFRKVTNNSYEAAKINIKIKTFEDLPGYKEWINRAKGQIDKGQEIVFTTKTIDILGMSSRSNWKSCQDLRPGSTWLGQGYNLGTLGSCVSKNIGIIYITDGSDFEGRGERMLARSSVWIVKNIITDDDIIFIQKTYPDNSAVIKDEFKRSLENQLGVEVTTTSIGLMKYYEEYQHPAYDDAGLQRKRGEFINCYNCGVRNHFNNVKRANNGNSYCQNCYDDRYSICDGCNDEYPQAEVVPIFNDGAYCESCLKDLFSQCAYCSANFREPKAEDKLEDIHGNILCKYCFFEDKGNVFECEECEGIDAYRHKQIIRYKPEYNSEKKICCDCYDELKKESNVTVCSKCYNKFIYKPEFDKKKTPPEPICFNCFPEVYLKQLKLPYSEEDIEINKDLLENKF